METGVVDYVPLLLLAGDEAHDSPSKRKQQACCNWRATNVLAGRFSQLTCLNISAADLIACNILGSRPALCLQSEIWANRVMFA
jgi:hypothetical protein